VAETRPAAPAKAGEPPRLRNAAYVTAGVAVVGLGMFAFFGLKANSSYSDLQAACGNGPCPPGHESAISDGRTEQTVANIGLAVFVVGAAATATIWVLSAPKKTGGSGTAKATARLDVGPSFTGLRGAF
jgi:hypothetical protein